MKPKCEESLSNLAFNCNLRPCNEARVLDLADRYLNSICTKRMLQAGAHDEAEKTVVGRCRCRLIPGCFQTVRGFLHLKLKP